VLSVVDNVADEVERIEEERLPSVVDNMYGFNTETVATE
jgi:hypothetical protein